MNIKKIVFFLTATFISANAFAGFLEARSYLGSHNGANDKVNLLVKSAPGRQGSFFAVLMKAERQISLYLIDEIDSTSYAMTPLEVTNDGQIGIVNDDPSLVITVANNKKGKSIFKIMSANSSNNNGFSGYLEFEGKSSKYSWLTIQPGEFKDDSNKKGLQISQVDVNEREANATFFTSDLSGNFTLREKFPGMYLLNQNSVLSSGTRTENIPKAIGIFLERRTVLGNKRKEMLLIDPKNDSNITSFDKD